jgi:hypothetical protein
MKEKEGMRGDLENLSVTAQAIFENAAESLTILSHRVGKDEKRILVSLLIAIIQEAIQIMDDEEKRRSVELKAPPRWETPEQWEKRTGKAWPDDWPVFFEYGENSNSYYVDMFRRVKSEEVLKIGRICVFTQSGTPPKDWRPEEEYNAAE